MLPLKYLSNFWRTLEIAVINCEINLIITCSVNCVISNVVVNQATTFAITDTKLYASIVTLLFQNNLKLLQWLKSGFKRTIIWNKYQSKVTIKAQNQYLDYLFDQNFQVGNRLFVLSFTDTTAGNIATGNRRSFLLIVQTEY